MVGFSSTEKRDLHKSPGAWKSWVDILWPQKGMMTYSVRPWLMIKKLFFYVPFKGLGCLSFWVTSFPRPRFVAPGDQKIGKSMGFPKGFQTKLMIYRKQKTGGSHIISQQNSWTPLNFEHVQVNNILAFQFLLGIQPTWIGFYGHVRMKFLNPKLWNW